MATTDAKPKPSPVPTLGPLDRIYRDTLSDAVEALNAAAEAPDWHCHDAGDEPPVVTAAGDLESALRRFVLAPSEPHAAIVSRSIQRLYDAIGEHEDAIRGPYDRED